MGDIIPKLRPSDPLVGFDLCLRLARLKKRRLYLPRGLDVPEVLRPCVADTVSRRAIGRGWEELLRLAASVKHGWYPATEALDRFGSAAAGDPVYEAGDALGKLLRTLFAVTSAAATTRR